MLAGNSNNGFLGDGLADWRQLAESAVDLLLIVNSEGQIRYAHPGLSESLADSANGNVAGLSAGGTWQKISQTIKMLAGGERPPPIEGRMFLSDASQPMWCAIRVVPLDDGSGSYGLLMSNIEEFKGREAELQDQNERLRGLWDLAERERRLVAYEIHDSFVQEVVGAKMQLESLIDSSTQTQPSRHLELLRVSLSKAIQEARRLIGELRPLESDPHRLEDSLQELGAELEPELQVDVQASLPYPEKISPLVTGCLIRIAQESLNNVRRHARIDRAVVAVTQTTDRLELEVRDNGCGFDVDAVPRGRFGIEGIRVRARLFQGSTQITTASGQGTVVRVSLPMECPLR